MIESLSRPIGDSNYGLKPLIKGATIK